MTTFDIVVTCKGRLSHLKQSLPQLLKQYSSHVYLVDYDCPEQCGLWAKSLSSNITVIKIENKPFFNLANARNLGGFAGSSHWILFIDADIVLNDHFLASIKPLLKPNTFYHGSGTPRGTMGTCLLERQAFTQSTGYDEVLQGWGGEDMEFYERLKILGLSEQSINIPTTAVIAHDDQERSKYHQNQNIFANQLRNRLYRTAVIDLYKLKAKRPDDNIRQLIYSQAADISTQVLSPKSKSDFYIQLNREITSFNTSHHAELSSVLHYHLDRTANQWQVGEARNTPICNLSKLKATLDFIKTQWAEELPNSNDSPIFLFSSGFRSGSTMLQRALMKQCFLWGEPYGNTAWLEHIIAPISHLSENWPPKQFIYKPVRAQTKLNKAWIANLYPEPHYLISAAQQYIEQLLKQAANNKGFKRWGFKEIRYNADHAYFLQFLYPKARFIFLYRNPYDAYRSYRKQEKFWHLRFNDSFVDTPEKFGLHWLQTVNSFFHTSSSINHHLIQYEDCINPDFDWSKTNSFLGFEIDQEAIDTRVSIPERNNVITENELQIELKRLENIVKSTAIQLGYHL